MNPWRWPLRFRLTAWYVLLGAATLALFSVLVYFSLSRALHRQLDAALETEAQDQLAALRDTGALGSERRNDRPPPGLLVAYFDQAGNTVSANMDGAPRVSPVGLLRFFTAESGGARWRYCTMSVPGRGFLEVYGSEASLDRSLRELMALLLVAVPVTSLVAGVGGLFLASRALSPIDRITHTAAQLGAEDLSRRLPVSPVNDEVGRLGATFNGMLGRLETSFLKQRQFTSDAAHELRAPLALMLARADVTLSRERTTDEYREALSQVHSETTRLSRLVAKLLTLARSEAGTLGLDKERLDLQALLLDVADVVRPLAELRGVAIDVDCQELLPLLGDQTRLTELLLNLVDNAIKAGGSVLLRGKAHASEIVLDVVDQGSGIADEHLERIFERFYQVDPSRSRGGDHAVGLGLAICQAIVREHGGSLTARSQPGLGSTFTVRLPTL